MTHFIRPRSALILGLACLLALELPRCSGQEITTAGAQFPEDETPASGGYTRSWAIVIGINYEKVDASVRRLVPKLNNAENDARALSGVLKNLYGYDKNCVTELIGEDATKQKIEKALNALNDDTKMGPNDSLVIFFSGHGTRIERDPNGERGAIYAADVQFPGGKLASDGCLRMHMDLLPLIAKSPAKHKLLILDCCHSGEIFSRGFQPRSETDDRRSDELFGASGSIQAIASCRDRQRASDGTGENSPFTHAFLQALQRIPARDESIARIGVNQLFSYMLPELKNLPNGQSPNCRLLENSVNDAEFSFFPLKTAAAKASFGLHRTTDNETLMLQAMVPGDHGNWWFEEMPWFVPNLRLQILKKAKPDRSQSQSIRKEELLKLTRNLRKILADELKAAKESPTKDAGQKTSEQSPQEIILKKMRLSHLDSLINSSPKDLRSKVEEIVASFKTLDAEALESVSAADLHLLAVAKHYLYKESGKADEVEDVETSYQDALKKFETSVGYELALKSLCHADYGYFLQSVKRDFDPAAKQFQEALAVFGSGTSIKSQAAGEQPQPVPSNVAGSATAAIPDATKPDAAAAAIDLGSAPPAFRVFVLCSEADAWRLQNRWGKANELYNTALHVAQGFDAEHELVVFVLNRAGWALMEQWRIDEAEKYFAKANGILERLARDNAQIPEEADQPSGAKEATAPENGKPQLDKPPQVLAEKMPAEYELRPETLKHWADFKVMLGYDYKALARYLHHLHGRAMAKRFLGREQETKAIEEYRLIVQMTVESLTQLRHGQISAQAAGDAERRLIDRLINSQERLADCNLYGDPTRRDLSEAADDYRRALHACNSMPAGTNRDDKRMSVLHRLSLALCLPSNVQDVKLAMDYSREAEAFRKARKTKNNSVEGTVGLVAEAVVAMFAEKERLHEIIAHHAEFPKGSEPVKATLTASAALDNLRKVIRERCDELNGNLHRDQLETLLLATKTLVQELPDSDRYHLGEDSDLLLYLCRLVLPKRSQLDLDYRAQEARAYLHPYYDTVLRSKLRMKPKHVKDLVEIQWEATRGEFFTKRQFNTPVLALYVLDDECHLILDVPGGVSRSYCLKGDFCVDAVKQSCAKHNVHLRLPEDLQQELARLRKWSKPTESMVADGSGPADAEVAFPKLQLRWIDPVRGLTMPPQPTVPKGTEALKPIGSAFPFAIPAGIDTEDLIPVAARSRE